MKTMDVLLDSVKNCDGIDVAHLHVRTDVETTLNRISALNSQANDLKEGLLQRLKQKIDSIKDESLRLYLIGYVYWSYEEVSDDFLENLAYPNSIPSNSFLRDCAECGEIFEIPILKRNDWDTESAKYLATCSKCVMHLRAMPYRDYLQTEHWQFLRGVALENAEYRCQLCNKEGLLDVHHRTYERFGNETPRDLTVLCRDCHGKFHNKVK